MKMKNNNKTSFFTNVKDSICSFEKYPEMATKPATTIYKYFIQLIAILTVVITIFSVYDISKKLKTTLGVLVNDIPEFTIENNELKTSDDKETVVQKSDTLFNLIIVDSNEIDEQKEENYNEYLKNNKVGIALLKDKVKISVGYTIAEYSYENIVSVYNINSKQQILDYFNTKNVIMMYVAMFIMLFIYLYCAYLFSSFMDALILGAIGYVTALILKLRIRFTAMIKIAIYALTLPILLNLIYIVVNNLTGIEVKYFAAMYMGIAYIYIITAILMLKADLIKRQDELSKIIEEQENVKRELERKEEEKRQEEEEQRRQEQRKKEKKEKEDDEDEGEPQGENA